MFSLLLRNLNLKTLAWGQAGLLLVILLFAWNQHDQLKTQREELKTARASYENPKTIEVVRTVVREGPIRIKTVIIERPAGERETTIVEERSESTAVAESKAKSEPVPVADVTVTLSPNRWLVGADLRDLDPKNYQAWTIYGGYSLSNRLDLMAGLGRREGLESHLMAVLRF